MTSGTRPSQAEELPAAKTERDSRRCPVCGDRLSQYNPGPNCYTHTVGVPWRGPSHRPR